MKCDWCESTENITTVNDMHACVEHIDAAFEKVFAPVKEALRGTGG